MHTSLRRSLFLAGLLTLTVGCGSSGSSNDGGGGRGGSGGGAGGSAGGAAGSSGGSGGTVTHVFVHEFASGLEGFMLNTFVEARNLGALAAPDASVPDGGVAPMVSFDATDGSPSPGSIKLTATYPSYDQYADVILNVSPAVDLTGKTLHAKVQLVQSSAPFPGGAILHASTGSFVYDGAPGVNVMTPGTWVDLAFPISGSVVAG
jgi:hypothetical protein